MALPKLDIQLPESMAFLIQPPNAKPYISAVVYRPPNTKMEWYDTLEHYLSSCEQLCPEVIIHGDFNLDLSVGKRNNKRKQLIAADGLTQCIKSPTRVTHNTATLLDHIYTTRETSVYSSGVMELSISDHYLVFLCRKLGKYSNSSPIM